MGRTRKYRRYHPAVWALTVAPIIVLSFGIPFYNRSRMVMELDFISFFLIIMDFVTVVFTAAAYYIERRTAHRKKPG